MLCQINQDIHHGDKVNSFVMLEIKQFEYLKKEKTMHQSIYRKIWICYYQGRMMKLWIGRSFGTQLPKQSSLHPTFNLQHIYLTGSISVK